MYIAHESYQNDILSILEEELPWEILKDKVFFITGASGMIGTAIVDVLMQLNEKNNYKIHVIAAGRNKHSLEKRFSEYMGKGMVSFYVSDINKPIFIKRRADFIIHAASNTHPRQYADDPIGTIKTNVFGMVNVLEYAKAVSAKRVLFLSSVEIYGEALKGEDVFTEDYCGYIDCNTLRANYPESKRLGEALCNAYMTKYNLDVVIPRLSRVFGPTMRLTDSKAMSQFLLKGVYGKDVILKSIGNQKYSYCYVTDVVSGIFYCLLKGAKGEAYNIADTHEVPTLKEIAEYIAKFNGRSVIYELPDEIEQAGASKVSVGILSAKKAERLGWRSVSDIFTGINKTLMILQQSEIAKRSL